MSQSPSAAPGPCSPRPCRGISVPPTSRRSSISSSSSIYPFGDNIVFDVEYSRTAYLVRYRSSIVAATAQSIDEMFANASKDGTPAASAASSPPRTEPAAIELAPRTPSGLRQRRRPSISAPQTTKLGSRASRTAPPDDGNAQSELRPRDHPWARTVSRWLDTPLYRAVSLFATLTALFALDFTVAFLPTTVDDATFMIIFIAFVFLIAEIVIFTLVKRGYVFSFFFWLDVIGTASIILDVPWLLGDQDEGDELTVARASRVSRIARTANTLRFTKLFRIFRVFRLVRVVRVFRFFGRQDRAQLHTSERRPSKIGLQLVDEVSKKVIVMVLLMMLLFPALDATPIDSGEGRASALAIITDSQNTTSVEQQVQVYRAYYDDELLFLEILGVQYIPKRQDEIDSLRANELNKFKSVRADVVIGEAWFSYRDTAYLQALFNLLLTLSIIVAFGVGTIVLSRDARRLVIAPIENMTLIVKRLVGNMFSLTDQVARERQLASMSSMGLANSPGKHNEVPAVDALDTLRAFQDGDLDEAELESAVMASLVEKMSSVFGVAVKHDDARHKKTDGDETEEDDLDDDLGSVEFGHAAEVVYNDDDEDDEDVDPNAEPQLRDHPELLTLDSVLEHPQAHRHFQRCVGANLSLEYLLFLEQAQEYRTRIDKSARHIMRRYINDDASSQVLLDESVVDLIQVSVEQGPWIGTFENAEWEARHVLEDVHRRFLTSSFVDDYLEEKANS